MSDTTIKNTELAKQPTITRNGISKVLGKQVFGKKAADGKLAGFVFYVPDVDVTKTDDVTWAGLDTLNGMIKRGLRGVFSGIFTSMLETEEYKTTGVFPQEAYEQELAEFTAGAQKLSDIEDELDELQALQMSLTYENPNFGARQLPEGVDADSLSTEQLLQYPLTAEANDLMTQTTELNKKVKGLRTQRATIEAEYKRRGEVRKAKDAAKKAAAGTAA